MKRLFVLSMLIPLAMVCSCQKQNAAAEQQLAQRKAELDPREKALDEREKALAEREKAVARTAMLPADLQLRALKKTTLRMFRLLQQSLLVYRRPTPRISRLVEKKQWKSCAL
jgi:hypothetical protein